MSFTSHQDPATNQPTDPAEILREIAAGQVEPGRLAELSDLSRSQVSVFAEHWQTLPDDLKRDTVLILVEMANENVALDFSRLFRLMMKEEDETVRARAIQGLWEDDSTAFLADLVELAHNDQSSAVQQAVAERLGRYSFDAETEALDSESASLTRNALFHLMDHGANWMVRRRALESASFLTGEPRVRQAILDAYESDFELEQAGAIVAMGHQLSPEWLPIVLRELENEDPDIRCEAARAAGEFEDPSAIDPLSAMIEDEDEEVRSVAILSIGRIGGKAAIDTLVYLETQVSDEHRKELITEAIEEATFLRESTGLEDR